MVTYSIWMWLRKLSLPKITTKAKLILCAFLMIALSYTIIVVLVRKVWVTKPVNSSGTFLIYLSYLKPYLELKLEEDLKKYEGLTCELPKLDPYDTELAIWDEKKPKVVCPGMDWVRCYMSKCWTNPKVKETIKDIICQYNDIVPLLNDNYEIVSGETVNNTYTLRRSDHVKVHCTGLDKISFQLHEWTGCAAGIRERPVRPPPPTGGRSPDVLLLAFDSTSRSGFIRLMPRSYRFIVQELKATVLQGYNILGDGTISAMFPMLTGKTKYDFTYASKYPNNSATLNLTEFIFHKVKQNGYETAYFEDRSGPGTFGLGFNGFKDTPADHYFRYFTKEEYKTSQNNLATNRREYKIYEDFCIGDTLSHRVMLNITDQFFRLPGKHFCLTFIADITHDDFGWIAMADEPLLQFLKMFKDEGRLDNTLIFIFGDHGPRFKGVRNTYRGRLEERLPLMAIRLPKILTDRRPNIQANLDHNANVITTAHDVHETILDALDLNQYRSSYKIRGAKLTRGISLFEKIPRNRSCIEAGIEPHFCACLTWKNISQNDPLYRKAAVAFVDYVNSLTNSVRAKCVPRSLLSVWWVSRLQANSDLIELQVEPQDPYNLIKAYGQPVTGRKENYLLQVTLGPGNGVYEASATYYADSDKFVYNIDLISRITAYKDEPKCIVKTHPHLMKYCYCVNSTVA